MKKIVNNKKFKIIFTSAIIVLSIILYYAFRTNEDVVTRVSRVLWAKYYNIECVDINCKYVAREPTPYSCGDVKDIYAPFKECGRFLSTALFHYY